MAMLQEEVATVADGWQVVAGSWPRRDLDARSTSCRSRPLAAQLASRGDQAIVANTSPAA